VPPEYNSNPTKSFPILIFLHGMGEKVWNPKDLSQLYRVKTHGPPKLIDQGQDFPFIVISPQCPFPSWDELTVDNFQTSVLKPGELEDENTLQGRCRKDLYYWTEHGWGWSMELHTKTS
jgi:predicted peptidase